MATALHSHHSADQVDEALRASSRGLRALAISFGLLTLTAVGQAVVLLLTGSVALLADTLHNVADALTAIPIAIAFVVGRRAATSRYTHGYARAEDLAGLVVLAVITGSAVLAGVTAIRQLRDPDQIEHLGAVAAAGVVGFLGNEAVARYRIRVGRQIGSAALVADGLHARTDGFTSLAVIGAAAGVWLGWPLADPIAGLLITVAILVVLRQAAAEVWSRLMDAVDPRLTEAAVTAVRSTPGVVEVRELRLRWVGHDLQVECLLTADPSATLTSTQHVAAEVRHRLSHSVARVGRVIVQAEPSTAAPLGPTPAT